MESRSYSVHTTEGYRQSAQPPETGANADFKAQNSSAKRVKPTGPPQSGPSAEFMTQQLGIKRVRSAAPTATQSTKKRKRANLIQDESEEEDEFAAALAQAALAGIDCSKPKRVSRKKDEEKRLRVFRKKAPQTYLERLGRVRTQRMFLIDRSRTLSGDGTHEEEVFDIAGSTGNIYQVTIAKEPKCTCPDGGKGNQCKHIIYVMVNVLKAREELGYQLALLSTELTEIFANAPPTTYPADAPSSSTDTGGQRKPIEGDCPVCVMEFDPSDKYEVIIWCKGACGNNIHQRCFEQWAKSKPGEVKCVYCRTPWKGDDDCIKRISKGGAKNAEGYVNVAAELGLSGHRDMSTYHQHWVRREFGS